MLALTLAALVVSLYVLVRNRFMTAYCDRNFDELEAMIMATKDQFEKVLKEIDDETTRIGTKLEDLIDRLENTGMTGDEESAILDEAQALADRLKTIGADPANPVPTEPPADQPAA